LSISQFVALFATLALANAGLIAEQPAYTQLSYAAPAYAADHYHHAPAASSSQYTKTISYSQPKAYISQPAVTSYHSYEPEHHYVQNYHHEPEHHIYAAQPVHYQQHYEHGSSEQNIVRSAHGTVSQISKAVDTPHSSVRKYDTRIINDGYKTVSYQPTAYVAAQPAVHSYVQPTIVKQAVVAQPIVKTLAQPAHYQYAAQPQLHYAAQPQAVQYAAHAPVLASKVHYSPAIEVAHASFESPLAHYSW
jgi:hypothetical protein